MRRDMVCWEGRESWIQAVLGAGEQGWAEHQEGTVLELQRSAAAQ